MTTWFWPHLNFGFGPDKLFHTTWSVPSGIPTWAVRGDVFSKHVLRATRPQWVWRKPEPPLVTSKLTNFSHTWICPELYLKLYVDGKDTMICKMLFRPLSHGYPRNQMIFIQSNWNVRFSSVTLLFLL